MLSANVCPASISNIPSLRCAALSGNGSLHSSKFRLMDVLRLRLPACELMKGQDNQACCCLLLHSGLLSETVGQIRRHAALPLVRLLLRLFTLLQVRRAHDHAHDDHGHHDHRECQCGLYFHGCWVLPTRWPAIHSCPTLPFRCVLQACSRGHSSPWAHPVSQEAAAGFRTPRQGNASTFWRWHSLQPRSSVL